MKRAEITSLKIPIKISVNYRTLFSSNVKLKYSIKKEPKKKEAMYFIPNNTSGSS